MPARLSLPKARSGMLTKWCDHHLGDMVIINVSMGLGW
jgi:hypothetical protein